MCRQHNWSSFPFGAHVCGCGRGGREISILLVYQCAGRPIVVVMFIHLQSFSTSYSPHESNASCTYVLREPRSKSLFVRTLSTVFEAHKTDPVLYVHVLSFGLQYYSQARGTPELQSLFEESVNLTIMIRHLNLAKLFATADESRETCSRLGI